MSEQECRQRTEEVVSKGLGNYGDLLATGLIALAVSGIVRMCTVDQHFDAERGEVSYKIDFCSQAGSGFGGWLARFTGGADAIESQRRIKFNVRTEAAKRARKYNHSGIPMNKSSNSRYTINH